jgi:predicted acyl esterase
VVSAASTARRFFRCAFRAMSAGDECNSQRWGGGRASCRLGWMVLGKVYAITIELFPIANLFCRGRRLRLDISSSNFTHFDGNPNSGERKAGGSSRASPATASSPRPPDPRTSCCRFIPS